jgi:hypothetical protein
MGKRPTSNALVYEFDREPRRGTVKRQYLAWRLREGLPEQCDMPGCSLNVENPTWKGAPIKFILDHVDGNPRNNHPQNLRLVCPNCGAQLETHGGANVGRIQNADGSGYAVARRDGRRDAIVFLKGVEATATAGSLGGVIGADDASGENQ